MNFNPRSHEGSDTAIGTIMLQEDDFNPRSHEGSDTAYPWKIRWIDDFNPRSHEGSDVKVNPDRTDLVISIHAPTRGATP